MRENLLERSADHDANHLMLAAGGWVELWYREDRGRQGDLDAMDNLAFMHGMGKGVRKSYVEANTWLALADLHPGFGLDGCGKLKLITPPESERELQLLATSRPEIRRYLCAESLNRNFTPRAHYSQSREC